MIRPLHNPFLSGWMTFHDWWYYTLYFTLSFAADKLYRADANCKEIAEHKFPFELDLVYSLN